jgi:hypothetical protein
MRFRERRELDAVDFRGADVLRVEDEDDTGEEHHQRDTPKDEHQQVFLGHTDDTVANV